MSSLAIVLIVGSAFLHTSWNLILKRNHGDVTSYALMCAGILCLTLHIQFWTPVHVFALPSAFWLFLVGSITSDVMYALFLCSSYGRLNMSIAYPMMRSLPIVFTLVLTSFLGLGKPVTPMAVAGMAMVFAGCLLMPMPAFSNLKLSDYFNRGLLFVILTALGTTGYTIFDSQAISVMRAHSSDIAKPIVSLTYYSCRSFALNMALWTLCTLTPKYRREILPTVKAHGPSLALGAICAGATYALVLIAMNYVTNVSFVQVFRQSALPIALVASLIFLHEKITLNKILGTTLILIGLVLCTLAP